MKHWIFIILGTIMFSCDSKSSTVCDGIAANEMCFNFKTSGLTIQHWEETGPSYTLEISNETSGSYYQEDIFLSIKLFDGVSDTVPEPGVYKGVSFISSGVHLKQFEVDFYLNGDEEYKLDVATNPKLEITHITGKTLHGTILCGVVNNHNVSDKQVLHVNFDNAWHL